MSEEKKAQQPQGFYTGPVEECPSCFYQPEAVEEPQVDEANCPSCFYQPAAKSED